jgi:hypothetical protein
MVIIKKSEHNRVGKDVEKSEHLHTAGQNIKWGNWVGSHYGRSSNN